MNQEVGERSVVQEIIGEGHGWWSLSNNNSPFSSSVSSSVAPSFCSPNSVYTQPSSLLPWNSDQQESLSQLLLSGLVGEEERCMYSQIQSKKLINNSWENQLVYPTTNAQDMVSVKQENHEANANEEIQTTNLKSPWNQILQASSPMSCVTSCLGSSIMVEYSNKSERRHEHPNSSECYSSGNGTPFKKARIQGSSSPQSSTIKVRKEKLGDRITALHQLVSPFGKTDTASVLQEAIGYIRFLHGQIEALSIPYMSSASGAPNSRHHGQGEQNSVFPDDPGQLFNDTSMRNPLDQGIKEVTKKDLRSRGLCLVPVSFPLDIGTDRCIADYWSPAFLGGFGR